MIVETAIAWLIKYPALVVTGMVDTVLAMMDDNTNFTTPTPALTVVTAANEAAKTAIANAANGGRELTAIKNAKMDDLAAVVRPLASYVTVTSAGDLTKLLSSGFPIKKPTRHPIGPLPAPTAPIVRPGFMYGMVLADTTAIPGAYIYNWRVALASAPTVYVKEAQTTKASLRVEDLTRGGIYNIQVSVLGAAGASEWSDAGNITAP